MLLSRLKNKASINREYFFSSLIILIITISSITLAAITNIGFEAESGTNLTNASTFTDSTASGGQGLRFSTASSAGCPLPAYPDETCTGVPAGTSLTIHNGNMDINTSNTTVENRDIRGCVRIGNGVSGVIIRKSKITCSGIAVSISDQAVTQSRLLLEDVEISCAGSGTGVSEASFTVRRANIHSCENGFDLNQYVLIEDSYIHELASPGSDPHEDGIQLAFRLENGQFVQGARNITVRHNTIFAYNRNTQTFGTSSIISNQLGDINILIEDNLLAGGAATLYCVQDGRGTNYQVLRNHFSTQFKNTVGFFFPSTGCSDETLSGNVYHETGQPINLD